MGRADRIREFFGPTRNGVVIFWSDLRRDHQSVRPFILINIGHTLSLFYFNRLLLLLLHSRSNRRNFHSLIHFHSALSLCTALKTRRAPARTAPTNMYLLTSISPPHTPPFSYYKQLTCTS